jgi:nitroimidazol reductase NimA-like FMN-containing flavoprotein (pyridoxamine 5'-phosphate oxidase superfamily)
MSNLTMTEQEREAFLAEPHIGVLSVASDNERPPLTVPIWYGYQPGGNITFFTGTQGRAARKTRLIQNAGVVSFLVQQEEFPYKYVTVEGSLVQSDKPPTAEQVLAIVRRYLPEEQAQGFTQAELAHPDSELILFTIRPDRWLTSDLAKLQTAAG